MAEEGVPAEWTDDLLAEHVADILFDGSESYEPDCVLCEQAIQRGHWEKYGYTRERLNGGD